MKQRMGSNKATTGTQLARRGDRPPAQVPKRLMADLRKMIDESRQAVAQAVNTALVWLYWNIGQRIRDDILKQKRAEYGEQIVATLSKQLAAEYGRGFSRQNLFRMVRFAEVFPEEQIVSTLSRQLSWSHFVLILPLGDDLASQAISPAAGSGIDPARATAEIASCARTVEFVSGVRAPRREVRKRH